MKKTILTILLCGVMVLGMISCGSNKNEYLKKLLFMELIANE